MSCTLFLSYSGKHPKFGLKEVEDDDFGGGKCGALEYNQFLRHIIVQYSKFYTKYRDSDLVTAWGNF